jgi:isopenicillin-N N-acyltransferase-like protein
MEMPIVVLTGEAYERGFAHGTCFRKEIASILARNLDSLSTDDLAESRRRAVASLEEIRKVSPQSAAELAGIAAGSSQPLHDIVLRSGFELLKPISDTGCSAVALKAQDGAIVAQNWDGLPFRRSEIALFVHFSKDGFEFAIVAPLGSLGVVGMNHDGLALVNNDLLLNATREGIPSQVVRRLILETSSVEQATAKISSLHHMGGRTYLLADRTGNIAGVEVSARSGANFLPPADVLLHTNNALLPVTLAEEDKQELASVYPSSASRLAALQASMASEERGVDGVKRALQDEIGAPDAVCKTASPNEATETLFSVVMDCARGEMHVAAGKPSINAYRRIVLPAR